MLMEAHPACFLTEWRDRVSPPTPTLSPASQTKQRHAEHPVLGLGQA